MASIGRKTYLVSLRCQNNIQRCMQNWLAKEDSQRSSTLITHISIPEAYDLLVVNSLSRMDDRFYADFNARKHSTNPNGKDWREFAIREIMNILNEIYWTRNYCSTSDEQIDNDDDDQSGSDKEPTEFERCTSLISKIRKVRADFIWREWSYERHWGPRAGVISISVMELGVEKVLLVSYIRANTLHYGFPKGKPNIGETIRMAGFREFQEETGVGSLIFDLGIDESDGSIMKKYPHIGPINRRRNRAHYYIITTTSGQFTAFQPNTHEVFTVEWHSVYRLPCCDDCRIQQKFRDIKGSDMPVNYHMVTLRDINNENSTILDILAYIDAKNSTPDAFIKYMDTHRKCGHHLA